MTFYVNDIEIIVQVDARSKHYLIETEDNNDEKDNKDDTADERFNMANLNRKVPDCNSEDCHFECLKKGDERRDHVATCIQKALSLNVFLSVLILPQKRVIGICLKLSS